MKYYDVLTGSSSDAFTQLFSKSLLESGVKVYAEYTGIAPVTFRSNGTDLYDWEISGNTDGVGNKTDNFFSCGIEQGGLASADGSTTTSSTRIRTDDYIDVSEGSYTISLKETDKKVVLYVYDTSEQYIREESVTSWQNLPLQISISGDRYIKFAFANIDNSNISPSDISEIMLNAGTTAKSYEPYGFKIPVICGGQTTNIYIESPIGAGESISKTRTGIDIATVNGNNTLIIDTAVQPSQVYIKYHK